MSIGRGSTANQNGAVALGAYSSTTSVGEINVGSSDTNYGYNFSNYRRLTGLYDPQSAHDAATKGYVDTRAPMIELTTADYNWPDDGTTPTSIALWKLNPGIYYVKNQAIEISFTSTRSITTYGYGMFSIANAGAFALAKQIMYFADGKGAFYNVNTSSGQENWRYNFLTDNILSQSTGSSMSNIMSQNATSSMVFADPSFCTKVRIGSSNPVGTDSVAVGVSSIANGTNRVAIGVNAAANANNSIALGANSKATLAGEVNIGNIQHNGYNNSDYRLLTGVYDGQNAHDAATKGQLDAAVTDIDLELDSKQDLLTAGNGISIADESGSLVISATGTEVSTINSQDWSALWQ